MALAAPLCFPLGVALRYGEPVVPFLAAILTTVVAGTGFRELPGSPGELGPREAVLGVSLIWLLVAAVVAIPFYVAGTDVLGHPVDAMFEALGGAASTVLDIGPAFGDAGPTAHTSASRSPRGWQWSS